MFALFWNLSAALNGYMRFHMPTNRAVDYLRSPRGLKWAIPVALVATPAYMFAMSVCATIIERGGPAFLNVLVMIFAWNAIKFAVMGVVSLPTMVCKGIAGARASSVSIDRSTLAEDSLEAVEVQPGIQL
jgi:hypothetical protein